MNRKQEAWAIRKAAIAAGVAPADAPKVPTAIDLHRELNLLKKLPIEAGGFPWMYQSTKWAPQGALRDLDAAFKDFFRRLKAGETPGYPRFKARWRSPGHFAVAVPISVEAGRIHLPRIGKVRLMPGDRAYIPDGQYEWASVKEDGDHWHVSVRLEVPEAPTDLTRPTVGLDAGVRDLAHLSDGTVIPNPKALERESKRLRKAKLSVARKQRAADKRFGRRLKGQHREESKRLQRARRKVARLSSRVAHVRADALHKATAMLARTYSVVVVEDLRGGNMTRRRRGRGRAAKAGLNRSILDSGMLRIRPLLAYKMPLHGGQLIVVPAAFTSQTCSRCGARNYPGSSKTYHCATCGLVMDRDQNASLNIRAAASSTVAPTHIGEGSREVDVRPPGDGRKPVVRGQAAAIRLLGHDHV